MAKKSQKTSIKSIVRAPKQDRSRQTVEAILESAVQILEAEGLRQSAILKSEGEKQAAILSSEGLRQATILKAEGEKEASFRAAEARERSAEAEAKATDLMSRAISNGNLNSVNYFIAQKYIDALGKIASSENQKVIMLPVEAMGVIGAISGIADLTKGLCNGNKYDK